MANNDHSSHRPFNPDQQFEDAYGDTLEQVLDVRTWIEGHDLAGLYDKLREEVAAAAAQENDVRQVIRQQFFPKLAQRDIPEAGVYSVTPEQIEQVHRLVLFNGAVEAVDANLNSYDSLPLTATQIGIALVRYNGSENTWVHRFFRRDLRERHENLLEEAMRLLERRQQRGGLDEHDDRDLLNRLVREGVMNYVERAAMLHHAQAVWRVGHGSPVPFSLLTGSGLPSFLSLSLKLLRELLLQHKRFLFIPSSPARRELLTLGSALEPLEYMVVDSARDSMYRVAASNRTLGSKAQAEALQFVEELGPQILVGIFRASQTAPVYLFYAHRDHIHEAALIALADSVLQAYRGFPMLIDLADTACRNSLGIDTLKPNIETAFAEANMSFRYDSERGTRDRR